MTGVLQQLYEQQQIFGYHTVRARQAQQFYQELCEGLPPGSAARVKFQVAIADHIKQLSQLRHAFDQTVEIEAESFCMPTGCDQTTTPLARSCSLIHLYIEPVRWLLDQLSLACSQICTDHTTVPCRETHKREVKQSHGADDEVPAAKRVKTELGTGGATADAVAARQGVAESTDPRPPRGHRHDSSITSMPIIMPLPAHVLSLDPSAQQYEPLDHRCCICPFCGTSLV
jgi:hypothetical protein